SLCPRFSPLFPHFTTVSGYFPLLPVTDMMLASAFRLPPSATPKHRVGRARDALGRLAGTGEISNVCQCHSFCPIAKLKLVFINAHSWFPPGEARNEDPPSLLTSLEANHIVPILWNMTIRLLLATPPRPDARPWTVDPDLR